MFDPTNLHKYYINVCRPITPVKGCDRLASACQMKYEAHQVRRGRFTVFITFHVTFTNKQLRFGSRFRGVY